MANIKLNELSSLNLSGAELFNDSESFMTELNEDNEQMKQILGGDCGIVSNLNIDCKVTCLQNTILIG